MEMDEIVNSLLAQGAFEQPAAEKTFEELGDFQFSTEKDRVGVLLQDPSYVKKSCTNCYGRGGVIQSYGGRRWQPCGCLIRGYRKARRAHDETEAFYKKAKL